MKKITSEKADIEGKKRSSYVKEVITATGGIIRQSYTAGELIEILIKKGVIVEADL